MEDIHRIMIGLGKAIQTLSCSQGQILMTKMTTHIGEEIGLELIEQGVINHDTPLEGVIAAIADYLKVTFDEITTHNNQILIRTSRDPICPNVYFKRSCPSICPFIGLFRGVYRAIDREVKIKSHIDPRSICTFTVA